MLREGARTLLVQAIEAEVAEFLAGHADKRDVTGRARLVRNGHLPERTVQTGIGEVTVKAPRVRDRAGQLRFASAILPPYLRRTKTMEELLPWLYLKGISTGGFPEALAALLGRDAPGGPLNLDVGPHRMEACVPAYFQRTRRNGGIEDRY